MAYYGVSGAGGKNKISYNSEIYASLLRFTKYHHATTNQLHIYNPDNLFSLVRVMLCF